MGVSVNQKIRTGVAGCSLHRFDIEEYSALAEEQGKDVVIRRENKTNRRKGKPPLATGTAEGE